MLLLNRILPLHRMTPHSFGLVLKEQVLCAIQDSWLYTKTFLFLNFLCSKKALEPYGMHQKKKKKNPELEISTENVGMVVAVSLMCGSMINAR